MLYIIPVHYLKNHHIFHRLIIHFPQYVSEHLHSVPRHLIRRALCYLVYRLGLLQSVDLAVSMNEKGDYTDINLSTKVVKIIQNYTDTVN